MTGVTIGIGARHSALAQVSARCLMQMAGINVVILSGKDLVQSGLTHPAALKMKLFDIIPDDEIFYFDADWFCIKKWDIIPFQINIPVYACNDFVSIDDWPGQYASCSEEYFEATPELREGNIRRDYVDEINLFSKNNSDCSRWINTGFWIANRKYHKKWLDYSLNLYNNDIGHHPQYYEQPAMNRALDLLQTDIHFLPRKYNILLATGRKWPSNIIGMHVKVKHHSKFLEEIIYGRISEPNEVQKYFLEIK